MDAFRRTLRRAAVPLAVFLAAWAWASGGRRWSTFLHPDELKVAGWTQQACKTGWVSDRVYPGGWFELMRLRVALARAASRQNERWLRWTGQDGAVTAASEETFWARPDDPERPPWSIQAGRDLNAFLFALTALAVFLGARTLGACRAAAAFAAAIFAAQPVALEHAHYCETDMGLAAGLAVASWAMARFLAAPSASRAIPALLLAGFAVSCKYTLAPLAAWAPAAAAFVTARGDGAAAGAGTSGPPRKLRLAGRFSVFVAAALALFAAGFLAGTPALWHDPSWFRASAAEVSARTYAETKGLLGPFAGSWWAGPALRLGGAWRAAVSLGTAFWIWAALSVIAWARLVPRRQLAGIPLFLALFLAYALFGLPWFRDQELLPVVVVAAFAAALPVEAALRVLRPGRREDAPIPPA